jgi:hypothetical protein
MRLAEPANGSARPSDEPRGEELGAIFTTVRGIVDLELRRVQLRVVTGLLGAATALLLLAGAIAIAVAAGLLVAAGTRAALAGAIAIPWVADLSAGLLLLLALALAGAVVRSAARRRITAAALPAGTAREPRPPVESREPSPSPCTDVGGEEAL